MIKARAPGGKASVGKVTTIKDFRVKRVDRLIVFVSWTPGLLFRPIGRRDGGTGLAGNIVGQREIRFGGAGGPVRNAD
jgi:hypothetical protein